MGWYMINGVVTRGHDERRSVQPSSPPPSHLSPLEELFEVGMCLLGFAAMIAVLVAILSGQRLEIDGSGWLLW